MKPLGMKAYGSIPHLPASRMGPGDYHAHEGQARIATEKARDKHDRVIVTEKLDGSCVAVARHQGEIIALGRAGYLAQSSKHRQHQVFAAWVRSQVDRFASLPEGSRIVGEWLYVAHGTIYEPNGLPFVPFDLIHEKTRAPHDEARAMFAKCGLKGAAVISDGEPISVKEALSALGEFGMHGAQERVEGAVWRVERHGVFDFLVKFVRHDKIDGKYLPGTSVAVVDEDLILWPDLLRAGAAE